MNTVIATRVVALLCPHVNRGKVRYTIMIDDAGATAVGDNSVAMYE
jgi:hypothetical protein